MSILAVIQADNRYSNCFNKIYDKEVIKQTIDNINGIENIRAIVINTYNCKKMRSWKNIILKLKYSIQMKKI
ncbi:hypothetical protein CLPUN_21250 [Clostridium puniceum]|uniref:Uncharacterized protein n=1 Tax=Clostridium puniceum TaxID=29367 RepID=A0A1S8TK21_9CLOT|nr:hypothetical protein [Clostridium puniceum]OOM77952.1 hypothetical protein CLPUN_21250 [Clostridium puniceum]